MPRTKNKIPKLHIKKGDIVRVLSGSGRGKEGRVQRILLDKQKAIVEGINMVSKHIKPNQANPNGGIIKQEAPIHVSNLMLLHGGKPTRVGRQKTEDGKGWNRVAKKSGEIIK